MQAVASTTIRRDFAGRERDFRLGIGELGELERLCGAGIGAIAMRLAGHQFQVSDIWETVRLGLKGGGAPEIDASALVRPFREGPLNPFVQLASEILIAALSGAEAADASRRGAEVEAALGDLSALYRVGGMMGLDARRIDALTLAEFRAMIDGFAAMHGAGDAPAADRDEYEAILAEEMAAGRA